MAKDAAAREAALKAQIAEDLAAKGGAAPAAGAKRSSAAVRAVTDDGDEAGGAVSGTASAKSRRRGGPGVVVPHQHCNICRKAIEEGIDPALCEQTKCHEAFAKKKRQARFLWIAMYALMAIAFFPVFSLLLS